MFDNSYYIDILRKGSSYWNQWRIDYPEHRVTYGKLDFADATLTDLDLQNANLSGISFRGSSLINVNLKNAHLLNTDFQESKLNHVDFSSSELVGSYLDNLDLRTVILTDAKLDNTFFRRSNLKGVSLEKARIHSANFYKANLEEANLHQAGGMNVELSHANLRLATLTQAYLFRADLTDSDFTEANLSGADLSSAFLFGAKFLRANLTSTNLQYAQINETDFQEALLDRCRIHGISAWNIKNLDQAIQKDLILTKDDEFNISVDDIEIAQFIYILQNNQKLRKVIDTITSKVVLILGRFSPERKNVLDALRIELRKKDFTPVIFDFEKPSSRNLTETVSTLALLSRFVIADLTDPRSIPQELTSIIRDYPSLPIQPIIQSSESPYGMFEDWKAYHWVLPIFKYETLAELLKLLESKVIDPANNKVNEIKQNRSM
jgi:uncharacterized protein YjbI with pentapeptide repeats